MADLMNYSVVRNGNVTVSVPRYNIVGEAIDSKTGQVLLTINTTFPGYFAQFTQAELDEMIIELCNVMVRRKIATL